MRMSHNKIKQGGAEYAICDPPSPIISRNSAPSCPRKIRVFILLTILVFNYNLSMCSATDIQNDIDCIILAKVNELYDIELVGMNDETGHTITISFDYDAQYSDRLVIQSPYSKEDISSIENSYSILDDSSSIICTIIYVGIESVAFSEMRARLHLISEDYEIHLLGIHSEEGLQVDIMDLFPVIIIIFSLFPFILLVPEAVTNLESKIEEEVDSRTSGESIYGSIIKVLLPFFTIGLTLMLFDTLSNLG